MGTEMTAFIEYDRAPHRWNEFFPGKPLPPPFDPTTDHYSLTVEDGIYTGSKDYKFFGAIAGVRNETNIPPLFPPRGLPKHPSPELQRFLQRWGRLDDHNASWLTLGEINAALDHQHVDRRLLSFETHTILAILASLTARLGHDRVRLVFAFNS